MVRADACHQDAVAMLGTTAARPNIALIWCLTGSLLSLWGLLRQRLLHSFANVVHCIVIPPTAATEMTDDMSGGSQSDQADEVEVNVTA